ncbi:hypothetical protein K3495_g12980 [Podosphaera aphanis]|nr:hypothetical protein K3495_g12980 [Podosphaera aphanis]
MGDNLPENLEIPQPNHQDINMGDDDIAPILGGEKQAVWPKWNGSPTSFPLYFARLKIKIAGDYKKLGGNKIICHSIMDTIPESKQQRVSHWFLSGGPAGDYDVELFLAFMKDKFSDRQALQTAGKTWYIQKGSAPSYIPPAVSDKPVNLTRKSPPLVDADADGDVQMSGINLVALVNALVGKLNSTSSNQPSNGNRKPGNSDRKPRAKWLSRSEANKLIEEERCLRCKKRGHIGKNCPNFRPALRSTVNHTAAGRDNDVNNDYSSAVESLSGKD